MADCPFRTRFVNVSGPHPLDCDSVDLANFAVGWDYVLSDLRRGLTCEQARTVEAALTANGVPEAFVLRNNLVAYKKVLVGIMRGGVMLTHELRRLATFFREPPATIAPEAPTTGSSVGRGFFRPSRHRELCDALGTITGLVAGVYDARRFGKAVCCVPRHPGVTDRSEATRTEYGQPANHYRVAGLLSEPLPAAFKAWRLLEEAREESL